MDRKKFLKKGIMGMGSVIGVPAALTACTEGAANSSKSKDCQLSPKETRGPFPTKTPTEFIRENIVSDRIGVALLVKLTIHQQSDNCQPLAGVIVDLWQCDKDGYYSEYGGMPMQKSDFTKAHFLRGRQTTNPKGQVSFISIYPGWYRGRAPHLHVEVLDKEGQSLRSTQIAFPDNISDEVYATANYPGAADTPNSQDGIFANSLEANMADSITGNVTDGYTMVKTLVV